MLGFAAREDLGCECRLCERPPCGFAAEEPLGALTSSGELGADSVSLAVDICDAGDEVPTRVASVPRGASPSQAAAMVAFALPAQRKVAALAGSSCDDHASRASKKSGDFLTAWRPASGLPFPLRLCSSKLRGTPASIAGETFRLAAARASCRVMNMLHTPSQPLAKYSYLRRDTSHASITPCCPSAWTSDGSKG